MSADLQRRFDELTKAKADILAACAEEQAAVDALVHEIESLKAQLAPLVKALNAAKVPLFEIDMERARLSRSIRGKTG